MVKQFLIRLANAAGETKERRVNTSDMVSAVLIAQAVYTGWRITSAEETDAV